MAFPWILDDATLVDRFARGGRSRTRGAVGRRSRACGRPGPVSGMFLWARARLEFARRQHTVLCHRCIGMSAPDRSIFRVRSAANESGVNRTLALAAERGPQI